MNERVKWIDSLRGFAIVLVILGHAGIPQTMRIWIYSFHIPLFFFISGYVFSLKKVNNFKEFLIKKIKGIVIPLICFSFVAVIFDFVYYGLILKKSTNSEIVNELIGIPCQMRTGNYQSLLWFLSCLFVAEIVFYFVVRIGKDKVDKILLLIMALLAIAFAYIKFIKILLPWAIETSLIATFFMGIGYILKLNRDVLTVITKKYLFGLYLIINIVFTYLNYTVSGKSQVDLIVDKTGNQILFVISALAGIMTFVIFFIVFDNIKIISFIGRNSIIFYALSGVVKAISDIFYYNILHIDPRAGSVITGLIYLIIQCLVIAPIAILINKRFKFILGKF